MREQRVGRLERPDELAEQLEADHPEQLRPRDHGTDQRVRRNRRTRRPPRGHPAIPRRRRPTGRERRGQRGRLPGERAGRRAAPRAAPRARPRTARPGRPRRTPAAPGPRGRSSPRGRGSRAPGNRRSARTRAGSTGPSRGWRGRRRSSAPGPAPAPASRLLRRLAEGVVGVDDQRGQQVVAARVSSGTAPTTPCRARWPRRAATARRRRSPASCRRASSLISLVSSARARSRAVAARGAVRGEVISGSLPSLRDQWPETRAVLLTSTPPNRVH